MIWKSSMLAVAALSVVMSGLGSPAASAAPGDPVDPGYEAFNFSKHNERSAQYLTPEGQTALAFLGLEGFIEASTIQAEDPERFYLSDGCFSYAQTCSGDYRLARWKQSGAGKSREILYTARNGGTISGHVWKTKKGPKKRPLVVITNGSVQAPETLYWFAAQTLAKAGYIVVTWDPQMQGRSDTFGAGPDMFDGVPSQSTGTTFFDGTQDALDFALSKRSDTYCPQRSRSGTSHCDKQKRRVKAGKNTAYNPYAKLVDPKRIGLAGHSFGASGVSWVGNSDKRVDAVVAWDNLCDVGADSGAQGGGGSRQGCAPGGLGTPKPRVPSLGLSADYGLYPQPYLNQPDPQAKSAGSRAFSKAKVDTGSIVIRGGTHYEFSYIPTPTFGATLRGADLTAWYTTAWMDYYVKGKAGARSRLLTDRWQRDQDSAAVDPDGDANLFSQYYASRLDLGHTSGPNRAGKGKRVTCEDLRDGCDLLSPDSRPEAYSYVDIATRAE